MTKCYKTKLLSCLQRDASVINENSDFTWIIGAQELVSILGITRSFCHGMKYLEGRWLYEKKESHLSCLEHSLQRAEAAASPAWSQPMLAVSLLPFLSVLLSLTHFICHRFLSLSAHFSLNLSLPVPVRVEGRPSAAALSADIWRHTHSAENVTG